MQPEDMRRLKNLNATRSRVRMEDIDCDNRSDRTMLLGLTPGGNILHVYAKEGCLHAIAYTFEDNKAVILNSMHGDILLGTIMSCETIDPSASDYDFCALAVLRGYNMNFALIAYNLLTDGDYSGLTEEDIRTQPGIRI